MPTFNLAVAWRQRSGNTLFVVYDDTRPWARTGSAAPPSSRSNRSFAVKLSRPVSF